MSDQALQRKELALIPPRIPISRDPKTRLDRPTAKIREAIRLMIQNGLDLEHAAAAVELRTRQLRIAFSKPAVREYVRREQDVFRAITNAKNNYRLAQIRDAANNMPAVNAIKELRTSETESITQSGTKQTAGIVINIVSSIVNPTLTNDANDLTIPNSAADEPGGEK